MFKKIFNRLLDYIAYVILGLLGLGIFNLLYLVWFTEMGKIVLSFIMIFTVIIWAFVRAFKKD